MGSVLSHDYATVRITMALRICWLLLMQQVSLKFVYNMKTTQLLKRKY